MSLFLALLTPPVAVWASPKPTVATTTDRAIERPRTLIKANFDSRKTGKVTPRGFRSDVGRTNNSPEQYDDMTIVKASKHGRVLRTTLHKGTIRGLPRGNHGEVLVVPLPRVVDQACISYDVRFSSGFDFSLGGKLPGLLGVAPGISPGTPTGGGPTDQGWSGRVMWVGPKAYSWARPGNMAVTYLYHPGQESRWGDNVRWNRPFVAGRWHSLAQCYTLNSVGRADGRLEVWLDGHRVRNDTDVVYRKRSNVHITHLDWSVFRGGDSLTWAGKHTGTVDIDNLRITGGSPNLR